MSDDFLRERIVQYLIAGLLALVVLFLIYGLVRGEGDDDVSGTFATPVAPHPPKQTSVEPQVGCQRPGSGATDSGNKATPPNPGLRARKAGRTGTVSLTVPVSTQECRVVKIRVQLDATTGHFLPQAGRSVTKNISVLTGPPVRKIRLTVPKRAGTPQVARAMAITSDGRFSSGVEVRVR